MKHIVGEIFHWVTQVRYIGIFSLLMLGIVGLPIPDETLLVFAGYLAYKGNLHLAPAILAAFLGAVCGISVSYGLGRSFGLYLLQHYGPYIHISNESLERAGFWFRKNGKWTLFFGYFLPGIRHLTAYVAGAARLELPIFGAFAYLGAAAWCASFVFLGYTLGDQWEQVSNHLEHHLALVSIIICVAVLLYWFFVLGRGRARK